MRLFWYFALAPLAIWSVLRGMEVAKDKYLPRFYVFDPASMQQIVKDALISLDIDASPDVVMARVYAGLKERYPGYIANVSSEDWVFNNAGNAMGSMVILHASLTEYLIFFGTTIGTEGHTGTHFADDYFTIMNGEEYAALPYATKAERYLPGDQHHMAYGVNKQYRMPPGSFALELAQGYIPTMLPFGFIEVFTSTFDIGTLFKTVYLSAREITGNLLKGKI